MIFASSSGILGSAISRSNETGVPTGTSATNGKATSPETVTNLDTTGSPLLSRRPSRYIVSTFCTTIPTSRGSPPSGMIFPVTSLTSICSSPIGYIFFRGDILISFGKSDATFFIRSLYFCFMPMSPSDAPVSSIAFLTPVIRSSIPISRMVLSVSRSGSHSAPFMMRVCTLEFNLI